MKKEKKNSAQNTVFFCILKKYRKKIVVAVETGVLDKPLNYSFIREGNFM